MLRLRPDPQIPEDLVDEVCAAFHIIVDPYICMNPAVSMRGMCFMDFFNDSDDFFPVPLLAGLATFFPLVVAGPADAHKSAELFDVVFPGQCIDYFVFFGFKGTYTCSPFSIFTV